MDGEIFEIDRVTDVRYIVPRVDMPQVMDIERRCFRNPWTATEMAKALSAKETLGVVVESSLVNRSVDSERIMGFMVYSMLKNRIVIHNVAVHPEETYCGYGKLLVDRVKLKLCPEKRDNIVTEIRETNVGAQMFFKKMGFKHVKTLHEYWDGIEDDCYVFEYRVPVLLLGVNPECSATDAAFGGQ